jgi:hypothetical protein
MKTKAVLFLISIAIAIGFFDGRWNPEPPNAGTQWILPCIAMAFAGILLFFLLVDIFFD